MEAFRTVSGIVGPLFHSNISTDVIIRIERLVSGSEKSSLGQWAFEPWRYRADGKENPDFILNQQPFRNATILLTGPNFACGSSREGAVWAIRGMGIRCVIAPSFGNIFYNNCFQNGVLPIMLSESEIDGIWNEVKDDPIDKRVTVDLERQVIDTPNGPAVPFLVDALWRRALLEGLDGIGLTMKYVDAIDQYQKRDRQARSWIYSF